jgi:hypothetical protein
MTTAEKTTAKEFAELIERADRDQRRALLEEAVAAELAKRQPVEQAPRVKPAAVRSQMTAAEKSRYIQKYGREAYERLPWSA